MLEKLNQNGIVELSHFQGNFYTQGTYSNEESLNRCWNNELYCWLCGSETEIRTWSCKMEAALRKKSPPNCIFFVCFFPMQHGNNQQVQNDNNSLTVWMYLSVLSSSALLALKEKGEATPAHSLVATKDYFIFMHNISKCAKLEITAVINVTVFF